MSSDLITATLKPSAKNGIKLYKDQDVNVDITTLIDFKDIHGRTIFQNQELGSEDVVKIGSEISGKKIIKISSVGNKTLVLCDDGTIAGWGDDIIMPTISSSAGIFDDPILRGDTEYGYFTRTNQGAVTFTFTNNTSTRTVTSHYAYPVGRTTNTTSYIEGIVNLNIGNKIVSDFYKTQNPNSFLGFCEDGSIIEFSVITNTANNSVLVTPPPIEPDVISYPGKAELKYYLDDRTPVTPSFPNKDNAVWPNPYNRQFLCVYYNGSTPVSFLTYQSTFYHIDIENKNLEVFQLVPRVGKEISYISADMSESDVQSTFSDLNPVSVTKTINQNGLTSFEIRLPTAFNQLVREKEIKNFYEDDNRMPSWVIGNITPSIPYMEIVVPSVFASQPPSTDPYLIVTTDNILTAHFTELSRPQNLLNKQISDFYITQNKEAVKCIVIFDDNTAYNVPQWSQINIGGDLEGKTINKIKYGENHAVFLCDDGTVCASGSNLYGQIGDGTNFLANKPKKITRGLGGRGIPSQKTVIDIAAGSNHSVALTSDGDVYVWGSDQQNQLAQATTNTNFNYPILIDKDAIKTYFNHLFFSSPSLPNGLSFNSDFLRTGIITGRAITAGKYSPEVMVRFSDYTIYSPPNDDLNSYKTKGITFLNIPFEIEDHHAPASAIIRNGDLLMDVGVAQNIKVTFNSVYQTIYTRVTGLPAGMRYTGSPDGFIGGTPLASGTYNVTIATSYKTSETSETINTTKTVVYTVNEAGDPAILLSNQNLTVGTSVNIKLRASDVSAILAWSATGLPAGMVCGTGTSAAITGTPTTAGTFNSTITLSCRKINSTETTTVTKPVTFTIS